MPGLPPSNKEFHLAFTETLRVVEEGLVPVDGKLRKRVCVVDMPGVEFYGTSQECDEFLRDVAMRVHLARLEVAREVERSLVTRGTR